MKKLAVLFILFLAYSFDGHAQEFEKFDSEKQAKKEIEKVTQYLSLDDSLSNDIYSLLLKKHKDLAENKKKEDKEVIYHHVEAKLKATFTAEQYTKLESNKALLFDLIH
ncbi:hypothetical protein ACFSX9_15075 [Flavobacterium ardleyense]|uniref:Peptidylprolyl isomerase n=1 Tax=Flavobacterium ardleyense TaxID=2038737 RepID=A0ABW5ZAX4_9FLAO